MSSFLESEPGLFHVRYATAADMTPALQTELVDAVVRRAAEVAVALVFELGSTVRWVEVGVPTFWLEVTGRPQLRERLRALAVVTDFSAVRVAVKGFNLANTLRGAGFEAASFRSVDEALAWARSFLSPPSAPSKFT